MQNSVNHRTFERKWHFQLPAGSTLPPVAPPSTSGATSRVALRTVVAAGGLFYSPTPAPTQGSSAAGRLRAGAGSPSRGRLFSADVLLRHSSIDSRWVNAVIPVVRRGACSSRIYSPQLRLQPPGWRPFRSPAYQNTPPWSDVRLPAELKHITKRRRRN